MNPHEDPLYDNRIGEECQKCGSLETFDTFDGMRVCRYCNHHERFAPRPVRMITHDLVRQHEHLEKTKRLVEAQSVGVDIQKFVKQYFNYK